ncbi:MAG: hypothetical protein JJ892_02440 [Balneola sp.]|nr:hypothetical protein [Balneola sp.]MBO6651857.1 hypothetical protein [Balneola sp.]MBO6710424.1 hypothetical protein [Balneola sp.]MBO6799109.1 hypothetical protein [Balneola sp.]MBO6870949.1 hypothetical protein [Balneola sp.]
MKKRVYYIFILALFISCETTKDDTILTDFGRVFVSSNTQSKISIFDFSDINNKTIVEYAITSDDAEGIYYDKNRDIVYQVDRENNRLNAYSKLSANEAGSGILPSAISTSDFSNPRGLTSDNNIAIVAQDASEDNGQQNSLFMYDVSATEISLRNQFSVNFPLWDIQLVGNTLYAVEDESDSLAIFNNFFGNSEGAITPNFKIKLDGVVRAHGLFYNLENDLMIITDVGDVTSGIEDGQLIIIEDFNLKTSLALQQVDKAIPKGEMLFIKGSNTLLQNPVDVIYHNAANRIIVAERSTNGGMFLSFEYPNQTDNVNEFNSSPLYSINYNGISNLFIDQ